MNSEESQLLVSDDYEACGTNVLQDRILHQRGLGERSVPMKETCPCWETSQETTEAVVPQSSLGNFLQLHFPHKMSFREKSSLSQTFNFMEGPFLWILLLLATHTSHSSHSLGFPKVCQQLLHAQCCAQAVSLPSQQPCERDGASPGTPLVLRRDLMCLPAQA